MLLSIKLVKECPSGHRGEFIIRGRNRCEIQISKKRNQNISEFGETLLHEVLHLWVTILQSHGLKEGIRLEHKFINEVVPKVVQTLNRHYAR